MIYEGGFLENDKKFIASESDSDQWIVTLNFLPQGALYGVGGWEERTTLLYCAYDVWVCVYECVCVLCLSTDSGENMCSNKN